mmetsp:Transcript_9437/g.21383  ORF Transcript_9437/g.21383 Transcript_9437/m.21383 type:complete len:305 (-) Transcript_9437:43-957(-)
MVEYRPRYTPVETSDEAYKRDQKHRDYQRIRVTVVRFLSIFLLVAVSSVLGRIYFAVKGTTGPTRPSMNSSFKLAKRDSLGFFHVPDDKWQIAKSNHRLWIKSDPFMPSFVCKNEVNIAGKFVCNPKRMMDLATNAHQKQRKFHKDDCLVYASGGGDTDFSSSWQKLWSNSTSTPCEIHVFTTLTQYKPLGDGVVVHPYVFHPKNAGLGFGKTLDEAIDELGHRGRRISIFALDCEGCEKDLISDLLGAKVGISQLLLQVHGSQEAVFKIMEEQQYVMFHREPSSSAGAFDTSWIKMASSFFED